MENILSLLIWLPVIGMVAIAFIPREREELIRITAAVTTGIQNVSVGYHALTANTTGNLSLIHI